MNPIRRVAALATLALAASALVAAPAHADAAPTFTWSFSDYLAHNNGTAGFTSHAVSDGATDSPAGIVFGGGEGTGSLADGDLDVTYTGSVTYTWHADITFSNPEVIVDGDEGAIVADVSWAVPETGSADDVVLTTFDPATASVNGGTFTATPDWSTGSWAPELLAALPDSVDAFFKTTGSSSDGRKAPATFTAGQPAAEADGPTVATETSYDGTQVLIDVDGTGFNAVTNPGDMGVYVAVGPAGGLPGDQQVDMDKFADAEWVMPQQMADGTFSVTLDPTNDVLDPSVQYAVYTWQAHSHSNTTQDTETPIEITWSKLAGPTSLTAKVAKAPTTKKPGSLSVAVSGGATKAAGKVTVVLTKKGQKAKTLTAKVVAGAGTVKLPKLSKGTWSAKATFLSATAAYKSATKTVKVKVKAG